MSAQTQHGPVDRALFILAERQHGVLARRQLLNAGVSRHEIAWRLDHGRLHVIHRGVYAVGHRILTSEGWWIAAVLAAGPGAVLSHRSAAALWDLRPPGALEVTSGRSRRPLPGIVTHTSQLPPDEVTTLRAIPVTTIPRTLLDLAAVLPTHQVERAANEAEVHGHTDHLSLVDMVERYPRRQGIRMIKEILDRLQSGATVTRSELEDRFLAFIREVGLPAPRINSHLLGFECDCVWRQQRVVVELDGYAAHGTTAAFERDRSRDRALNADSWRTVRITWRQLQREPENLAMDLTRMLAT